MNERIKRYLPKSGESQTFGQFVRSGSGTSGVVVIGDQWSLPPQKFPAVSSTGNEYQVHSAIKELSMNISALRSDIQELTHTLRASFPRQNEHVLLIREGVSREQATMEISNLLEATPGELYPSDISEELRLDYELVLEVLKELHSQGKVEFPK